MPASILSRGYPAVTITSFLPSVALPESYNTPKPVRRSGNLIAVHYSAFLVNRQRLPQEHFRLCVLVQSVPVEGELVETVGRTVMEVALCAGEYGQRLSVRCVHLIEHRFCFLVLENLRTADLYIPQAVQSESGAMGCGIVSIHYDRLERLLGLTELTLGPKAVGHVREIDGRRARGRFATPLCIFNTLLPRLRTSVSL